MTQSGQLQEPLAVIGMACRLPGANSLEEFWSLLVEGRSGLSEFPPERLDRSMYYSPEKGQLFKTYTYAGGWVEQSPITEELLPIPPEIRNQYDLGQQTVCEVAVTACRNAGYDPLNLPYKRTAVYVGNASGASEIAYHLAMNDYADALAAYLNRLPEYQQLSPEQRTAIEQEFVTNLRAEHPSLEEIPARDISKGIIATSIANLLHLTGPAAVVDAACAGATMSLELGAQALFHNRADMALIGGASFRKCFELVVIAQAETLSPDGVSRPYDSAANGLVPADGYGFMLIKKLSRAIEDGDQIRAVIRNTSISSDGKGKSFWAPRQAGQVLAIRRSYDSGIDPNRLQYFEMHATSTQVGDETEFLSMTEAIGNQLDHKVPVASVKANVGHSLETAGMSGMIKTILAMQHQIVPPVINCQSPNPSIRWNEIPFELPFTPTPWPEQPDGSPRLAAIDSFGIGGVNSHVVIEEYLPEQDYGQNSFTPPPTINEPIAIVGRGCIYPNSFDLQSFAETIASEITAMVPPTAERILDGRPPRFPQAGYLTDYEFDWKTHKVPPKRLEVTNPVHLFLMDAALEALTEAGIGEENFDRQRVTTIAGAIFANDWELDLFWSLFMPQIRKLLGPILEKQGYSQEGATALLDAYQEILIREKKIVFDETASLAPSSLSTCIAKRFDLMGGTLTLDAGSASSHAALMAGMDLLRSGKCDRAVCASSQYLIETGASFVDSELPPADGAGVVVLQRLSDAEREGREIFGIISQICLEDGKTEKNSRERMEEVLATNDIVAQKIGNTLGSSGMASLIYSTLVNEPDTPVSIYAVNSQGFYQSRPHKWKMQLGRIASEQLDQSIMTITASKSPSSAQINTPENLYHYFLSTQTGCPQEMITPATSFEGDLCLSAAYKQSILKELFQRLRIELSQPVQEKWIRQAKTVHDLWTLLEESQLEIDWEILKPDHSTQNQRTALQTSPVGTRHLRLIQRMVPQPLPNNSDAALVCAGSSVILGNNGNAESLSLKLAEAGNLVYQLDSDASVETLCSQLDQINAQAAVQNLFVMISCPEVMPSGNTLSKWQLALQSVTSLIDVINHWVNSSSPATPLNLTVATRLGGDFGRTGQILDPQGAFLRSFCTELVRERSGLKLKLIDFPSGEPTALLVKELYQELCAGLADQEVGYSRGTRYVNTAISQALPEDHPVDQTVFKNWTAHGSFLQSIAEGLHRWNEQIVPNSPSETEISDLKGLWVGTRHLNSTQEISHFLSELYSLISQEPALQKVVLLETGLGDPKSDQHWLSQVTGLFLNHLTQEFPNLCVSQVAFEEQHLGDWPETVAREACFNRSESVRFVLQEDRPHPELFIANAQSGQEVLDYPMLDTAVRTEENQGICYCSFEPQIEPFLTGHVVEGIPLLPAVMVLETFSEAASWISGGKKVVGLRNLKLLNGFRMAQPNIHHSTVKVRLEGNEAHCEHQGEFYDKNGVLKDSHRRFQTCTILVGDEPILEHPPLGQQVPQSGWFPVTYPDTWQEHQALRETSVFYGPEMRTLKEVLFLDDGDHVWGKMVAPPQAELGGQRSGNQWMTHAALFDGMMFSLDILLRRTTGSFQLPIGIEQVDFGRPPREGESVTLLGRFLGRKPGNFGVEFSAWGEDGAPLLVCRNMQLAELPVAK